MRIRVVFATLCLLPPLLACQRSWPPEVVARWNDVDVDLTGIELYLEATLDRAQSGEELVRQYRRAAEEMCVKDELIRKHGPGFSLKLANADKEITRRQITVNSFIRSRLDPELEATLDEIEAFHAARPEYSHRSERRFVEHIFRRTNDQESEDLARDVLDEVRTRFIQGDAFRTLAVEYSQSETGASGGSLGLVSRGDLHEAAAIAVFSLEIGEISQPVPVHGGLAVFVVTQIYPEKDFSLEDLRGQIAQQLQKDKVRQRLDIIAEETNWPSDVYAVPESRFHDVLESDAPDTVLYSDDSLSFTVAEWRERQTGGSAENQLVQYAEFLRLQRVYHFIVTDGFFDDPGRREAIDARFETALNEQLVNLKSRELLIDKASGDPAALKTWYNDNRNRYQSSIEMLIDLLVVKPSGEVEDLANSLRAIALSYTGGDLETPAASIRNATVSRAWVSIATLDAYHPRVKAVLLTLDPPACGPTFNIGGVLHLFCLEDRKEPQQLSFEEARDLVVDDYIAANEQELYTEIRAEILDRANFEFNESRVREALHAPAPQEQ